MPPAASLFARKLRDHRLRGGTHGRMTQETLAETLGVSVDAIGKYERSVSFMRGDLEHRLSERLGWDRETVLACREDWETRQDRPNATGYRILDDAIVGAVFDGDWSNASRASMALAQLELPDLPGEFAADDEVFRPIYDAFPEHWAAIMAGDQMVAKWTLPFLLPEDEALFRAGEMIESEMSVDRIHRPILPGTYYGYCPALVVKPGHEAAAPMLLSSFVSNLEAMARRGVLLHGIGTVSCSPAGAQVCRDLGMVHLCNHVRYPDFGIWEMTGAQIPGSVFGRRSARLARCYTDHFAAP